MRKWYKYNFDTIQFGVRREPMDANYADHGLAMNGYDPDESYESKDAFFCRYYFDYHYKRLENYDEFIRLNVKRDDSILSIASGRCANELALIDEGYNIVCSDLEKPECYENTLKLFPTFKFEELNILNATDGKKYDVVLCLSLIYLFDDYKLNIFFENVYNSLKPNGRLILDSAGSPDNFLSYLINDIYLKYEISALRIAFAVLKKKRQGIIIKHHGYRRKDNEIVNAAQCNGFKFKLLEKKDYAFLTEFRRSMFFNKLVQKGFVSEKIFSAIGKHVPYIRMFNFSKISGL